MVDQEILVNLKKLFDQGPDVATADDFPLVLEFVKQLAVENDDLKEELEASDFKCNVIIKDVDRKFWFSATGGKIDYGDGEVDDASFAFIGDLKILASVVYGEIDGPSTYMAGQLSIEGNIADGLAFNEIILVALDAFEDLTSDLEVTV